VTKRQKLQKSWFELNRLEFDKEFKRLFPRKFKEVFSSKRINNEQLYRILFNIKTAPKCKVCGKETKWVGANKHYGIYCCRKCVYADQKNLTEKKQLTSLKRFGTRHPTKLKEVREKREQTNLKKYGFKHASKNEHVKDKMKKTNLERYGFDYALKNEHVKDKMKKTNLERYGFENASKNKKIKAKTRKTNLKRYGVEYVLQNKEIKQKIAKTNLERYGVKNVLSNKKIRAKANKTTFKKYGVKNVFSNSKIKQKIAKTNLERYGFENPACNEQVKEKIRNSIFEHFGVYHQMHDATIRDKVRKTQEINGKNSYKYHSIVFNKQEITVQGYEEYVILDINNKIKIDKITTRRSNMPKIEYKLDGKLHTYYPDIKIKSNKKLYLFEVKSTFTLKLNTKAISAKIRAMYNFCRDSNYTFIFCVSLNKYQAKKLYNTNKPYTIFIKNPKNLKSVLNKINFEF
jgi:hypothetical protein